MRLSSAIKLLAVLAVALAVGLVAATKSMDFPRMKALLAEEVRAATGRQLTIAGPLELRLGVIPKIIATNVSLANVPGGSRPEMVKIERVEAEVALLPLLKREIRVLRLVASAPDVVLENGRDGRPNWLFTPAETAPAAAVKSGVPATRFTLREVRVKNARLSWRDGAGPRVFNLHKLVLQPEANTAGRLAVQVVGDLERRMLDLGGRVAMPASADKPWTVQVQGAFDGLQAKVEGAVAEPLTGRGIDLAVVMQGDELGKVVRLAATGADAPHALGPFKLAGRLSGSGTALALTELEMSAGRRDSLLVTGRGAIKDLLGLNGLDLALAVDSDTLAGLSRLTGGEVPPIGPFKLTGALSGGGHRWKLADLKASLGGSDAVGELVLDTAGRLRLSGALNANLLALADFITPAAKPGEKLAPKALKAAGDGRLFPAEPLAVGWLRGLDADVVVRALKVSLGPLRLAEAEAVLHAAGGRLALRPIRAWAAGGPVEGELELDAAGAVPTLALRTSAKGVDLGRLLKDGGTDALSGGRTDVRLDLRGRGASWRALMASATGEAVVGVGDGRLRNGAIDWPGGGALVQLVGVLNPASQGEETTPLSCAAMRFVVKDGVAVADRGIAVETGKVNVVGAGMIDLREERLDLGLTPRVRDGGGALSAPLAGMARLRGSLAEPALGLEPLGGVRLAADTGPSPGDALLERLGSDSTPCRTALGLSAPAKPALPDKKAGRKAAGHRVR